MEKELTTTTSTATTATSAIDFLMILPFIRISSFLCQKRGQVAISASLVLDEKPGKFRIFKLAKFVPRRFVANSLTGEMMIHVKNITTL